MVNDEPIVSPLPRQCDNLIVMNEQAYEKFYEDLKPGGLLLANANRVKAADDRDDIRVLMVPVDDIALELGNPKTANIILLGVLTGATNIVTREIFVQSLNEKFGKKPEVLEMNIRALDKGIEIGRQYQ